MGWFPVLLADVPDVASVLPVDEICAGLVTKLAVMLAAVIMVKIGVACLLAVLVYLGFRFARSLF